MKNYQYKAVKSLEKALTKSSCQDIHRINFYLSGIALCLSLVFLGVSDLKWGVICIMMMRTFFYVFLTSELFLYILKVTLRYGFYHMVTFKLWRYVLSYLLAAMIQITLSILLLFVFDLTFLWTYHILIIFSTETIVLSSAFLLIHNHILLRSQKNNTEQENATLQLRNKEAEVQLLKQQIQPHFLFNSLNTLKALYKKDASTGERYLILLSEFLRRSVSSHSKMVTTLQEELEFCENYLEMQQIRFRDALQWTIQINEPHVYQWYLPFFSLQPLLENAIKHNVLTKEHPLLIEIKCVDEWLEISNNQRLKSSEITSIGSGLNNLADRYQLWSGDQLIIKNIGSHFIVRLKLQPYENRDYRG